MAWGVASENEPLPANFGVDPSSNTIRIDSLDDDALPQLQETAAALRQIPRFPQMDGVSDALNSIGLALEEREVNYHPPQDPRDCSQITLDLDKLTSTEQQLLCAVNALSSLDPKLAECARKYDRQDNEYTIGKRIQCLSQALPAITQDLQERAEAAASALESVETLLQTGGNCQCSCSRNR